MIVIEDFLIIHFLSVFYGLIYLTFADLAGKGQQSLEPVYLLSL